MPSSPCCKRPVAGKIDRASAVLIDAMIRQR